MYWFAPAWLLALFSAGEANVTFTVILESTVFSFRIGAEQKDFPD